MRPCSRHGYRRGVIEPHRVSEEAGEEGLADDGCELKRALRCRIEGIDARGDDPCQTSGDVARDGLPENGASVVDLGTVWSTLDHFLQVERIAFEVFPPARGWQGRPRSPPGGCE